MFHVQSCKRQQSKYAQHVQATTSNGLVRTYPSINETQDDRAEEKQLFFQRCYRIMHGKRCSNNATGKSKGRSRPGCCLTWTPHR